MDIIVTTPKTEIANAAAEASHVIAQGGGEYFRYIGPYKPLSTRVGNGIWYVEDGFIRGFAIITRIVCVDAQQCSTTGREFRPGWYVYSRAESWKWIRPIPMKGFQGWRYYDGPGEVIGQWRDPRPVV